MKFGKEFTAQMVPEWQEAYIDYNYLKTLLKEIQRFKQRNRPPATPAGLKQKATLYRAPAHPLLIMTLKPKPFWLNP
jgi:hypothetical protein